MNSDSSASSPLDVPRAVRARRSVRRFLDTPVSDSDLEQVLEAARLAPSSYNLQPWRVVVAREKDDRARLAEACFGQIQIVEAPVSLVFAVEPASWRTQLEEIVRESVPSEVEADSEDAWVEEQCGHISGYQEFLERNGSLREYAIKDAMIAAAQSVLVATSLGLSSCYMNGWIELKVVEAIGGTSEDDLAIAVVVALGYAGEDPAGTKRLPLERVVFDGTVAKKWQR